MNGRESPNDIEQSNKVLIFSVCAFKGGVEWADGGCSVENSLITTSLSKFAANLDLYIRTLHLLNNHRVIDRFDRDGSAWVEVYTIRRNHDLAGIENEVATIQIKIQQCIHEHDEIIQKISSNTKKYDGSYQGGNASAEALAKCLTTKSEKKFQFDFPNQGTKILKSIRQIEAQIHSSDNVESATGEVMCFNENDQKVTLFKLKPAFGQIILSVTKPIQREKLLDSQKEKRQVSITYSPILDLLRPDKSSKGGVLVEIVGIGPTQTEIPE